MKEEAQKKEEEAQKKPEEEAYKKAKEGQNSKDVRTWRKWSSKASPSSSLLADIFC
jgi:hypothetical protein